VGTGSPCGTAGSGSGAGSPPARSRGSWCCAAAAPISPPSSTPQRRPCSWRRRSVASATIFNQELFGGPTSLPWGLEIDAAHRPDGYAHYTTFHPTFLYEAIWNLSLAAALVWLGRRKTIRPPGLFALYVAGYSLGRIGEELLRVDPAHHILGLRLNFFVASALCVTGLAWFARTQWPGFAPALTARRRLAGCWCGDLPDRLCPRRNGLRRGRVVRGGPG